MTISTGTKRAVIAGLVFHFGWLAVVSLYRMNTGMPLQLLDFSSFFYAADAVFNGDLSPYSRALAESYGERLDLKVYPFIYPPCALPVFFPFSLLGYDAGAVLMMAANAGAFAYLVVKLADLPLRQIATPQIVILCLVILVVFDPITRTMWNGQINLFVTILILLAWDDSARGRSIRAGVLLGLATVLKTYPAVLFLVFLVRWDHRALAAGAATVCGFIGLSLLLMPVAYWHEWLFVVAPSGGYAQTPFELLTAGHPKNQSLNGLFSRLTADPAMAKQGAYAASTVVLAVSGWCVVRLRALDPQQYCGLAFSILLMATIFIAPWSWLHHYVFALPAMFYLLAYVDEPRNGVSPRLRRVALVLVCLNAVPWRLMVTEIDHLNNLPIVPALGIWMMLVALPLMRLRRSESKVPEPARI